MSTGETAQGELKRYVVGITGASGVIYGVRLVEALVADPAHEVHVIVSAAGARVLAEEFGVKPRLAPFDAASFLNVTPEQAGRVVGHSFSDIGAGPASGTFRHSGMVVAPCSVKTLGALAAGLADNLITRAGDVALKEGLPLLLALRETPLSAIHTENMLRLQRAGAVILPASPAFYHNPKTIEDLVHYVVQKILERLGVTPPGAAIRWTGR